LLVTLKTVVKLVSVAILITTEAMDLELAIMVVTSVEVMEVVLLAQVVVLMVNMVPNVLVVVVDNKDGEDHTSQSLQRRKNEILKFTTIGSSFVKCCYRMEKTWWSKLINAVIYCPIVWNNFSLLFLYYRGRCQTGIYGFGERSMKLHIMNW